MSEKAQEVRERRLESMAYLKEYAEIAFDFILNEFDEKTAKGDYTPVHLFIPKTGIPCTNMEVNYGKRCDNVNLGFNYRRTFIKLLEQLFNAEKGYTAIVGDGPIPELIVQIDFV